jgi:hypothetical protein
MPSRRTAVSPASSWQAEEEDEEDYEMGVSGMTGMWGGKEESETDYEVHYQEPASHSQSPQVATAKSTKAVDEVKQKAALAGQCADFPTLGPHDMTLPKAKAASFEARRGVHDPGWAEDFGSAQAQRSHTARPPRMPGFGPGFQGVPGVQYSEAAVVVPLGEVAPRRASFRGCCGFGKGGAQERGGGSSGEGGAQERGGEMPSFEPLPPPAIEATEESQSAFLLGVRRMGSALT